MNSIHRLVAGLGLICPLFLPPVRGATVTWVGGSGDWSATNNWSTGVLPGASDDVVIGPGPAITVTHSSGAHTVRSIGSQQAFVLSGGALAVSTTFQASNSFTLSGGTLQSATVVATNGFSLVVQSGTLDGVSIATNSTLDVGNSVNGAEVTVANGLVLNGTLLVGNPTNSNYGVVSFAGTQTLSGTGTVAFGGSTTSYNGTYYNALLLANAGTTLTIGPGVTIRGQNGVIGFSYGVGGSQSASVVDQGTISGDVSGGTIQINPQTFTSTGRISGSAQVESGTRILGGTIPNGSTLILNSGVTLDGVTIDTNAILDVGNSVNGAEVTVTNGLVLNGTLLVGSPTNSNYGVVSYAGTQTLSGNGAVAFGGSTTSYSGTYYNALILASAGTTLTIGPGITIRGQNGVLGYSYGVGGSQSASMVNQGTISCDVNGGTIQITSQTFSNQGLIQGIGGGTADLTGTIAPSPGTFNGSVQLASGATIQGGTVEMINGSALVLNSGVTLNGVTVNGTLDVGSSMNGAQVTVTNGLVLNGTLLVGNPTNTYYGGVNFAGTQTLSGNGSVAFGNNPNSYGGAYYNALSLANAGTTLTIGPGITIRGQNGTIGYSYLLGGSQSASVVNQGTISCDVSGGTIQISPQTFTSTGTFNGSVQVAGVTTILGGTIVTLNGSALILNSGVTLNGVTVNGTLDVGSSMNGAQVTVTSGLVLNGTLLVGNPTNTYYGGVNFAGTQTLSGNGSVAFGNNPNSYGGAYYNALFLANAGTTLTIGPGITIRGQNGTIGYSYLLGGSQSASVVNQGTISCDVGGGTIQISPQTFTSTGTFNGSVQVAGVTTILGGTIVTLNGSALILNSGVTLNGVTVNGTLDVGNSVNEAQVTVTNGLVLNGTLLVGNPTNTYYGGVNFAGTQTLSGNGSVAFGNNPNSYGGAYYNALSLANAGTTLTIGPGITIRGQNGTIGYSYLLGGSQSASVVNQGTISCDVGGGTIQISPQTFANQGGLRALAGTVVSLTGSNTLSAGSVTVGLGGPANYGKLNVSGNVPVSGALNVNLSGGYVPTAGSSFAIVSYGSESGTFTPVSLPGQGLQWQLTYGASAATLTLTNDLATVADIAYLRSTLDPVNFAPTNTTTVYTTLGVVTTWTNLAGAGDTEFYMQDASGGIAVRWSGAGASSNLPAAGSVVEVTAPLADANGLLLLAPAFSNPLHGVTIQGTTNLPAPQPLPFDTNIVSQPALMVRRLQGSYFLATNVFLDLATSTFTAGASEPLTNGIAQSYALSLFNSTGPTSATNYTVSVTNQTGQTFITSYSTNADFIGHTKQRGPFAVYGVLGQYVTNTPYTSGYQFIPTRAADLVALGPPQIVSQPTNQLLTLGANAAFAVIATGSSPLSYQWLFNGTNLFDGGRIAGSQSNLLGISTVQSLDVGPYEVVVTNLYGSVTSAPAILSVSNIADLVLSSASAPAIVTATQPDPIVQVTWAVTNQGIGTAPGGWYDRVWFSTNGVLDANSVDVGDHYVSQSVAPGTGYGVTIPVTLPMSGSGAYSLFVQVDVYNYIIESSKANNLSAALPGSFTLVPPDLAPVSLSAPASASWGRSVPIACLVTNQGNGGISNYWADGIYYSTNAVFTSNATLLAYVAQNHAVAAEDSYAWTNLTALPPVVAGTYYLFVVVNDPTYTGGSYTITETTKANNTSGPLALTILAGPAPGLLSITPSIGLTNGGTAVTVGGSGFEPGARLFFGGQLASSVSVNNGTQITASTPAGPLGVTDVMLANPDGNTVTLHNGYTYTGPPPSISVQPASMSVPIGSNAVFQVTASWVDTYQWQHNGNNLVDNGRISGSHGSTLTVPGAQPADAGNYQVLLGNLYGSTTSSVAVLTVIVPPTITTPPQPESVGIGGTAMFTVGVSGTAPFTYQWLKGASPLTGATGSALTLTNVQTTNQGQYSVVVSNAGGPTNSAPAMLTVLNYCASAQPSQAVYPMGATVPLPVQTFNCSSQAAAPNSSAVVWVSTGGTTRSLPTTTGASGSNVVNFVPLATEAGSYQVAAALPGQSVPSAQGTFSLVGMSLSTNQLGVQLFPGVAVTNRIILSNLTSVALTGVAAGVVGSPPDVQVQLNTPATLTGYATNVLTLVLTAPANATAQDQFSIQLTTAQGTSNTVALTATVVPTTPQLVVTPASLSATMLQSGQTLVNFTVANIGGATSGPVQVLLPQAPWLTVVTAQPIPPLAPGQTNSVTLALTPPANLTLGPYVGEFALTSPGADATVPFEFDCVSSLQGSLQVTVQDELSTYGAGSPNVSNATVTVSDFVTGSNLLTAVTGSSGIVLFSNLASAYYTVSVTAPAHGSFSSTLLVAPNQTNQIVAFLPLQLVDYTWVVTPTSIPDHYEFTLETTFETMVPWPVVTITPGAIDLCTVSGQTNQINLTITNSGIISAQGLNLYFGPHPDWSILPLASNLGDLPPLSSLVVPVTITQLGSGTGVPHGITAQLSYHVITPTQTNLTIVPIYVYDANPQDCQPESPTPPPVPVVCTTCAETGSSSGSDNGNDNNSGSSSGSVIGNNGSSGPSFAGPTISTPSYASPTPPGAVPQVKLRIEQSAVIAREAFKATLELTNGAGTAVSNLSVSLTVYDASNQVATSLFGIPLPRLNGLNAVDGTGILANGAAGSSTWTIVPATNAAPLAPTQFSVGGSFSYVLNGEPVTIPLFPVPITVLPTPIFNVDYFLQHDVFSDDPFTPQVEPSIPFALGILVQNKGNGSTTNFSITSAQPQIIENSNDLLIAFSIIGSQVGTNQSISPSLTLDFGALGPQASADGLWYMTSTLEGQFISFAASFQHIDAFGNTNTSLINQVNIHELNHVVRLTAPTDDGLPDFLVNDTTNVDALPGIVYSSDGSTYPVSSSTSGVTSGVPSSGNSNITVTASVPSGWVYLEVVDPGGGAYPIASVQRSDGNNLLVGPNVWQTPARIHMVPPKPNNLIHIFDHNSTGSYTVTYGLPITLPDLTTLSAVNVTATNATLNALVNPNGGTTQVHFEWGATTNYGFLTESTTFSSELNSAQDVALVIGPLQPVTTNHFRAVAVNSAGTSYGADMTLVTPQLPPPSITQIANQAVLVGQDLVLRNRAQGSTPPVTFSLDSSDPAGVFINRTNGLLTWAPSCPQGSSTNLIRIWATDSGSPPLSNSMTFLVTVSDCVQVGLGSTVMRVGTMSSVPLTLISSVALTNLSFAVIAPGDRLTNWAVAVSNSAIGSTLVQTISGAEAQVGFEAVPGQAFQGPAVIGALYFAALPGPSTFLPLGISNVVATEQSGAPTGNASGQGGRVVVIGPEPLLQAGLGSHFTRTLTLYANPGTNYELLFSTNLFETNWQPAASLTMTNLVEYLDADPSAPQIFYRAKQVP